MASNKKEEIQIFLAPRSNETSYKNFVSTIENGVDYSIIEPHLSDEGKKILGDLDKAFVWGNKETKKSSWDKMNLGDLVLFYKGREGKEREGKLVYAGRLSFKQHSKELGLALWPPKPGEKPWTCVFFLEDLRPVYIPITEVADYAGYSRNFIVQGFMPLNDEGTKVIMAKFGSVEKFLKHYSASDEGAVESDLETASAVEAHSEAQMLLLQIGRILEYDTYTPDKNKEAYGEKLVNYVSLKEIPRRFLGDDLIKLVREIDVIWFKDETPKFAFEVEHSTKFSNGFQRLYQLEPLGVKLFLISSRRNYHLFEKFINADPYFKQKEKFKFRDYKQLENLFKETSEFDAIKRTFLEVFEED